MAALFYQHLLQVYKAVWQKSTLVAVKVMHQQQTEEVIKDFLGEIELLRR